MDHSIWLWAGFTGVVTLILALDLGVFHRKAHVISLREGAIWSAVWIALALLFNAGIYMWMDQQKGLEFLTGYLIEKSLSVDNIFVWMVIFSYFAVPAQSQHRVLFLGILGAIIMRGLFIATGITLLDTFHWVIYVFGAFLVFTGIKLALRKDEEVHLERNPVLRVARRFLRTTPEYQGQRFFVLRHGKWMATPLFMVLLVVETTDLVFAVDSVPAILAITKDPFIVWTSNVMAILGLRALFFLVAGVLRHFRYLKAGLALVLSFVGVKMIVSDFYHVPTSVALGTVAGILAITMLASYLDTWRERSTKVPTMGTRASNSFPHHSEADTTAREGGDSP